ncbi:NAD(P)/FAD-dependent oxidoreductase [Mesobacillus harenae]|uniref:NAD(P)/FAD-dependent oxidoreductase n=1 Tax=Mesobacillus harenae TaxID=2213203 RepID=UPI0015801B4B|nr:NAD(P)/FAD-dependent oxidoreductase [Mesobacillus harenae]
MYDCLIIGGGIAGLQAAIQLGRYQHRVLVIDADDGRSKICRSYHNILGYPDGVSGQHLREMGREHSKKMGVEFVIDRVIGAGRSEEGFTLETEKGTVYRSRRLLFATGIVDRIPDFPEIMPCLGNSVYVCPDCDGYEVKDKKTIVMGAGNTGANMALTLSYWTKDLVFVNHERKPVDRELLEKLEAKQINYLEETIEKVKAIGADFNGVILKGGEQIEGQRGFIAYGGNEVKSQIARQLGVELHQNNHILVDPRTKMTNVENVWAAGDVVAHSEQVTIAMGDGSQAGIWIHKTLLKDRQD